MFWTFQNSGRTPRSMQNLSGRCRMHLWLSQITTGMFPIFITCRHNLAQCDWGLWLFKIVLHLQTEIKFVTRHNKLIHHTIVQVYQSTNTYKNIWERYGVYLSIASCSTILCRKGSQQTGSRISKVGATYVLKCSLTWSWQICIFSRVM